MITFLPYADFKKTAKILDRQRLGKQRSEAKGIYNVIHNNLKGYNTVPMFKMWVGYEELLLLYAMAICEEWISRGYKDSLRAFFLREIDNNPNETISYPPWYNNEKLHSSHRSRLLMKDYNYYSQFGWTEEPSHFYWWP